MEVCFGRLISLFGSISHKRKTAEEHYDIVLMCCITLAITNTKMNSFSARDGEFYENHKTRLTEMGIGSLQQCRVLKNVEVRGNMGGHATFLIIPFRLWY